MNTLKIQKKIIFIKGKKPFKNVFSREPMFSCDKILMSSYRLKISTCKFTGPSKN